MEFLGSNDFCLQISSDSKNYQRRFTRFALPKVYSCYMKFWLPPRALFSGSNCKGAISSHTLLGRYLDLFYSRQPHWPRRKFRLTHADSSCKWGKSLFYLFILTRGPGLIFWLLPLTGNLKSGRNYFIASNSSCVFGVRSSVRSNVLLGSDSNY